MKENWLRFKLGVLVGALLVALTVVTVGELARQAEAATSASSVARFRNAIHALNVALRDATQLRQDIIDQGGASFVQPILDDTGSGDPDPDLSSADLVSAAVAVQAINAALDDNSKEHRKALLKAES